jgi:hypothetical protein
VPQAGLCHGTENIDGDVSADADDAIAKALPLRTLFI